MAAAPARIHAPAFSRVTPPVGISRSCGIGASTSLKNAGPSDVAGNTLTMSAPACQAARISVGVKQPGITARSAAGSGDDPGREHRADDEAPRRRRSPPRAVAASSTVPAPMITSAGARAGQRRDQLDRARDGHRDLDRA